MQVSPSHPMVGLIKSLDFCGWRRILNSIPDLILHLNVKLSGVSSSLMATTPTVHFAEEHQIIIICLPPHTTHALQLCDIGVFGPLAVKWKSLITSLDSQLSRPPIY
ncbi:hypothetical protein D9758_010378 [Tetrapyrgos nigripes]|uniref:DDE-1 domain-containing protein n=1 Tax=Tetrapyrgos nigripes TaxID=182062 RepID=A0A8H5CZA7_9AGAR|nr:hypothetical protein D9758_010378 [Tetrapyrgos nigripes]